MGTATFDTNVFPAEKLVARAGALGVEVAVISVTQREANGATIEEEIRALEVILEFGIWDESPWGGFKWAGDRAGDVFEKSLRILSNGSFPPPGSRGSLTDGQRRQFRDAMILANHVLEGRDILVSGDCRAFINHGRRELIEGEFGTRIMTVKEFEGFLDSLENEGQ
ncbi:MAG: hypothetical protein KOO63_02685 [Bacteroidales bacterium]|nr:hypothetical protein [Candidatus Latescibacterota bacterium]